MSRSSVTLVVVLASVLSSVTALAAEPAAPAPAASARTPLGLGERPRFVLGVNIDTLGAGLDAGLRLGFVQVGVGANTDIFAEGYWGEAKLFAPRLERVVPYVAGRIGHYEEFGVFVDQRAQTDLRSAAVGLDLRFTSWLFASAAYVWLEPTTEQRIEEEDGVMIRLGFGVAL
jgi:hypothetical protein